MFTVIPTTQGLDVCTNGIDMFIVYCEYLTMFTVIPTIQGLAEADELLTLWSLNQYIR